ncbi:hypothetical protein PGTUg99_026611 [Puccinia graminis f. sp. tritici]|uniref:Uncharacterized protein n=1 Tax=Puccinia graminis f. sp. tritici TaxID=56615 RepID=A0A5B0R5I5_PUCGR|nr:hypothetical protein PGTUg99_026611 [Puccinia graminis f. sp. tritici]
MLQMPNTVNKGFIHLSVSLVSHPSLSRSSKLHSRFSSTPCDVAPGVSSELRFLTRTLNCIERDKTHRKRLGKAMLDCETSANETTVGLVVKALENMATRYHMVDLLAAHREPVLEDDDMVWVHDNWKYARQESLSTDELNTLNALLCRGVQTNFLPSLQQQLADLLGSLDLANLPNEPKPKLKDSLDIISQLADTVAQINAFVHSIAPIAVNPLQDTRHIDGTFGSLKRYRSRKLIDKFNHLICYTIQSLFDSHLLFIQANSKHPPISSHGESSLITLGENVIEATAQSSDAIDSIIKWSKQSDLSILQDHYQEHVNHLDSTLAVLSEQILLTKQSQKRLTNQPENESDWTDANWSSGHANDQPGTSLSADWPEAISLRPQLIKLVKTTIPLIKLTRILFKKLSSKTLTNKALFTFDTQLSSEEIQRIDHEAGYLILILQELLELMFHIYDRNELMNYMMRIEILHVQLSENTSKLGFLH